MVMVSKNIIDDMISKGADIAQRAQHEPVESVFDDYKKWDARLRNFIIEHETELENHPDIRAFFLLGDEQVPTFIDRPLTLQHRLSDRSPITKGIIYETKQKIQKLIELKKFFSKKKPTIYISKIDGIYMHSKKTVYEISRKRKTVVWLLKQGVQPGKTLGYKNLYDANKAVKEVNKLFKQKLKLKENLITHVNNVGYKLNQGVYTIEFLDD